MRSHVIAITTSAILGLCARADAFCGFYVGGAGAEMFNNATEVVLMRHGTTTVLSMQNNYQGPPEHFALVVPVPTVIKESQVKTLPRELFGKVDTLGAPRLVEYWEQDPCRIEPPRDYEEVMMVTSSARPPPQPDNDEHEYHVRVEAKFSVGEYDIEVLSAEQSTGLDRWLRDHKYMIPAGAEPLLRPYVEQGTKWFVAKVDPKKVKFEKGMTTLSPLRFHYESPDFTLPIRLGLANSSGTQDLIVNILAPNNARYEVSNYPNVTIPTNLAVTDGVRTRFGEFYAALFDHTLEQVPHAVVTEYSWDSGSCDPCPGPTLDGDDLQTFGADVIGSAYKDVNAFTLTRLHARYGKDESNDLVFRAVDPIGGGRGMPGPTGEMNMEVEHAGTNNFQGRYAILHPWTGAMTCASPVRGRWGDPPGQQIAAQPATNLAFAPRGGMNLSTMVTQDVPKIGVTASKPWKLGDPIRQPQGCGCQTTGSGVASLGWLAALGLILRRRRT